MKHSRTHWQLDSDVVYLNHGSFGATPTVVLEAQREIRARMERNPMQFFVRDWENLHDEAMTMVGEFVGAAAMDLAVVPNATAAVNAVLQTLPLRPGDEVLVTDHAYNACVNALRFVAERAGAHVVVAKVPFPIENESVVMDAVLACVTSRTVFALIDHVTSPTGIIFPIERLVSALKIRGIETLVDGAHAPGMLPLRLENLGAAYYTGNLHKWVCAPKGSAFLYVRRDRQSFTRPSIISHGANSTRTDRSRFRLEWDWTGTCDPTAFLAVPHALRFVETNVQNGWDGLREHNHSLVLRGREILCNALHVVAPAPESMIGSLAAVQLPTSLVKDIPTGIPGMDALQQHLWEVHHIEVPLVPWPDAAHRLMRISAQYYNHVGEYTALANALVTLH
jgi:isopenicillin-N epimerase